MAEETKIEWPSEVTAKCVTVQRKTKVTEGAKRVNESKQRDVQLVKSDELSRDGEPLYQNPGELSIKIGNDSVPLYWSVFSVEKIFTESKERKSKYAAMPYISDFSMVPVLLAKVFPNETSDDSVINAAQNLMWSATHSPVYQAISDPDKPYIQMAKETQKRFQKALLEGKKVTVPDLDGLITKYREQYPELGETSEEETEETVTA